MDHLDIKIIGLDELKKLYPFSTYKELSDRLITGAKKLMENEGLVFDETYYRMPLEELAEGVLQIKFSTFIILSFRVWNRHIETALKEAVIFGTGECEECGNDEMNCFDFKKGEGTYLECSWCQNVQLEKDG